MCDPVTAIAVSTVASIGGAMMQMQAQNQQAEAQQASLNYQRQVAENNAATSEALAKDATERGRAEERRHRQQVQQLLGRQQAVFGATGLQTSGSALGILGDTAEMGELDALQIRDNAEREAFGFRAQASNDRAQAGLLGQQAANVQGATIAPLLNATASVAGQWYDYSIED